jgi:TetR/AcrR family transcriptional regulator, repressor of fatR-cypB operon
MAKNKQEDILAAALILFAERGYDGTTVPMIADKAEVGAGTIYRYFENKESLVNSLFQNCVLQFSETLRNGFPFSNTDIREQFRHAFYQMIKFAKTNVHALLFIDSHSCARYLDEKSNKDFEELLEFLSEFLENGKKRGIVCPLPSEALISIVYGAFVRLYKVIQTGGLEETPELLKGVEESCWNAIRVH